MKCYYRKTVRRSGNVLLDLLDLGELDFIYFIFFHAHISFLRNAGTTENGYKSWKNMNWESVTDICTSLCIKQITNERLLYCLENSALCDDLNGKENQKTRGWIYTHRTSLVAQMVKNLPACNAGDPGSISGLGRCPGEEESNPLQYSCLEKFTDWGAQASVHGIPESDRTERLNFTFMDRAYNRFTLLNSRTNTTL